MREILFKAKRIDNGEWIIGSLIQSPYLGGIRSWISSEQDDKARLRSISTYQAEWRAFEVRTDTICQFTGLTDKNGQKIWENDVVDLHGYGFGIGNIEIVSCKDGGFYPFMISKWECTPDSEDVEVIGNIFDNPELIHE